MMPVTDTNTTDQTRKLEFASEAGSARSKWVAGILSVALVAWMGSGYLIPSHDTDAHEETKSREVAPVAVSVRSSVAEQVTHVFSAEGQGQPIEERQYDPRLLRWSPALKLGRAEISKKVI